jgi:hypothetical protein
MLSALGVFLLSEQKWIGFSEDDHNRRRREDPAAATHKNSESRKFPGRPT